MRNYKLLPTIYREDHLTNRTAQINHSAAGLPETARVFSKGKNVRARGARGKKTREIKQEQSARCARYKRPSHEPNGTGNERSLST